MARSEDYKYTEDGVLLVRKQEQGKAGALGLLPGSGELWFQCGERNPDRQYVQMLYRYKNYSDIIKNYALLADLFGICRNNKLLR